MESRFKTVFFIAASLAIFLKAVPAHAVCPVCTVAVGACVGLAQYLGIDDTITGVWIGGLVVSMIAWTIDWLNKKDIRFYGRKILVTLGYYALIVGPLWWQGIIGHPFNKIWGFDKLLSGILLGSFFFILAVFLNNFLKKRNEGRIYFPFQKVVVPVAMLGVLSGVFYFITC